MSHPLRFYVSILPNKPWPELRARFQQVEALGFDIAATADHFVDWSNPAAPWYELWTHLAAAAECTQRIRLATAVAQIPLRDPATLANHALAVDHISNGRFELGLGVGLTIDPSYRMMGIDNWSNKERVARFGEYLEVVDRLLRNETSSYDGRYYKLDEAVMSPRPLQQPRPPLMVAAMGPRMLEHAARHADIWNSMSFADSFDKQLAETRERIIRIDRACERIGRDPSTLVRSFHMFDPGSRASGGMVSYYESEAEFGERVQRLTELGITDIGLYYPMRDEQQPMFERIASDVIPQLKAARGDSTRCCG